MRKILTIILILSAFSARAEATFEQMQQLIQDRNYQAAAIGLENIISNHPNSAKAFYAMAQAQAGLGDLEKANRALNKAIGIDPSLKFASKSNIQNLKKAITPQSEKIEPVQESHFWLILFLIAMGGGAVYWVSRTPKKPSPKDEVKENVRYTPRPQYTRQAQTTTTSPITPTAQHVPQTVVVNNSNSDGFLTGILVGDMLGHHHDTTIIHEKEIIHDSPQRAQSNDNSWEDTNTKSSSWDDDSSKSSSWESDSSSSDSSWSDSGSSDSSSSWD